MSTFVSSLVRTAEYIISHPFNRNRTPRAITNWIAWQLKSRLRNKEYIYPFVNETRFYVRRGMNGITGNIYCGLLEWQEMGFALHFLRKTDHFVDGGANVGVYTILASGAVGATSHTFEPIPATFEKLVKNVELNRMMDKVHLYNMGLSSINGQLNFTASLDTANHIIANENEDGVQVTVGCLDSLIDVIPALIKVDVEGHEGHVLAGARRILSSSDQHALIIEWNREDSGYGDSSDALIQLLHEMRYFPVRYDPHNGTLQPVDPGVLVGNAIFIKDLIYCQDRVKSSIKYKIQGRLI